MKVNWFQGANLPFQVDTSYGWNDQQFRAWGAPFVTDLLHAPFLSADVCLYRTNQVFPNEKDQLKPSTKFRKKFTRSTRDAMWDCGH